MSVPTLTLNNGVSIPQLGLGVWQASDAEAEQAVSNALDAGYRLIDTASIYGNESGVGRAITASDVLRENIFVTTKLWNSDQGYENVRGAFENSLSKLELEYIDLYLIHWPMPDKNLYEETWRAFEELYDTGKVRAIGVSNFMPEHLDTLLASARITPALNQVEIHPDFQQEPLRSYCKEKGIVVESWSPLGGNGSSLLEEQLIIDIADAHGKSPAQVVLRWHIQSGLVTIPKSVHAERIHANIDIFDFELTQTDMEEIGLLDGNNRRGADPYHMHSS